MSNTSVTKTIGNWGRDFFDTPFQKVGPEENESGLEPLGRAILVEPYEPERTKSIIALPPSVLANERVLDVKVRVVAVGPEAWPDERARCSPGEVVFVAKMSGFVTQGPKDGKPYRLVNDRDVFARVTWTGEAQS